MAKKIFLSEDDAKEIIASLFEKLTLSKWEGRVYIDEDFSSDKRTAKISITPEAYLKIISLVDAFGTEVEWHGCVRRTSDNSFEIYDIITFPHEATGVRVETDQKEYEAWTDTLDASVYNAMRFHGHSHVNMGVTPSGDDKKYRRDILKGLPKPVKGIDSFYIFMIFNKQREMTAEIYDLTNNAVYDSDEIEIEVSGVDLNRFVSDAKKVVKVKTTSSFSGYSAYGTYGAYGKKGDKSSSIKSSKFGKDDDDEDDDMYLYGRYGDKYFW